jgi:hypothetical protein
MEVVLINNSNVKEWIPDMPEEFFKLYECACTVPCGWRRM